MNLCMSSNPAARPHFDFIKLKLQAIAMDHSNLTDADFGVVCIIMHWDIHCIYIHCYHLWLACSLFKKPRRDY